MKRRKFLKIIGTAGTIPFIPGLFNKKIFAISQGLGLSDPSIQPKFVELVPNALDPEYIFNASTGKIKVAVGQAVQQTGLVDQLGNRLSITIWGYGDDSDGLYSWPGKTFQVQSYQNLEVEWINKLNGLPFLITGKDNTSLGFSDNTNKSFLDPTVHWAYSMMGYQQFSVHANGVPTVVHLHGGNSDFEYDGNPEAFFNPDHTVTGPRWIQHS